jgi:Flp pilus assembly protein TadD
MTEGSGQPAPSARYALIIPALVICLLAVWWAVLLPRAERTVFARVPVLDEVYYLDRSVDPDPDDQGYFVSPLYPRLIAWSGSAVTPAEDQPVPPARLRGIRLLHVACWLGTVLMLFLISRRVLAPPLFAGRGLPYLVWLPSLLFVLYRPAAIFTMTILLEIPLTFLVTLFLFLLTGERRGWLFPVLAGVVLGLAGLLRGTVLVLAVLPLVLIWTSEQGRGRRLMATVVLVLAVLLPLVPASWHNSQRAQTLKGPTLNGGVNLYIGNGPQANGFYVEPMRGDRRRDPAGREFLAQRLGLDSVTLGQADVLWTEEALAQMRHAPDRVLGLWARKVWLFLQGWDMDQLTPQEGWRRQVPLLNAHFLPYGVLMCLAMAGALVSRDKKKPMIWWLAGLLLLVAAQSLFFVVGRYRLVLVPFLCLLAGGGLAHLLAQVPAGRRVLARWSLGAVLTLLIVYPWGLEAVKERWRPLVLANEAQRWSVVGRAASSAPDLEQALLLYQESVDQQPDSPGPWVGWAVTLEALERRGEAREVLQRASLQVAQDLEIRRQLVGLYLADGLRSDALAQAQALLRKYPRDAETLHNTTVLLADFGNLKQAMVTAGQLVDFHPGDPRGYLDLGVLLARSGHREDAARTFRQGLMAAPGHPGLQHNLELLSP